tara:strand:- start:797 stop:1951 length:1155 start_codon:yes stop_codon:yes gene_type:complete
MPDPNKNKKTTAKPKASLPGRKEKEQQAKDLSAQAAKKAMSKYKSKKNAGSMQKANNKALLKKASPEKKAAAKAKAIKGGMPQEVANKVFKMSMGSKSAKNSDSAFSMYSEKVMQMSPIFMTDPPVKTPPSNKLYSYEETNTKVKRSGGGSESSNVQKKSTSNLADYQKGLKDLGPGFKPTAAQTAAANKKVAELKKKDAQNAEFNKNISKSNKSSVEKSVNKKTTVLGKQTQAEILGEGDEYKKNRKARLKAERGSERDIAQKDSITAAKNYINKQSKIRKTTQGTLDRAHKIGNLAGRKSLARARGKEGEVLFSPQEINESFNIRSGNKIMKPQNPNKKVSKRNPLVQVGVQGPGSLGSVPKLSDLQMNIGDKALKYYNRKK